MATTQYSDTFEYSSFCVIMNTCKIEYSGVILLKEMCGKKVGTKIDKLILDPSNGCFSIPKGVRKVKEVKPPVEFKGVHTRFESPEPEPKPKPKRTTKKKEEYTTVFKVYNGRKIHKVEKDNEAYEWVVETIEKALDGRDLTNHFSVNDDGCIVMCGIWDEFELKKRIKIGVYSFARIK